MLISSRADARVTCDTVGPGLPIDHSLDMHNYLLHHDVRPFLHIQNMVRVRVRVTITVSVKLPGSLVSLCIMTSDIQPDSSLVYKLILCLGYRALLLQRYIL